MRFNYITSAALDSGLAISTIVIILALSLTMTPFPQYWGTKIAGQNLVDCLDGGTLDVCDAAIQKILPTGAIFGPGPGEF